MNASAAAACGRSGRSSAASASTRATPCVGRVVVRDAGEALQDLGERPVGDAVAVGEAAPDEDPRALEPREQLAHEPALADAGVAVDRDELRALLGDHALLQREQEVELALAADQRRVHPRQPARHGVRRLTEQEEGAHGLLPAAQLLFAEVVEDEAGSGAGGALGDDRLAGLGELLEPGGGVDGGAGDDRLAGRRVERRDGFAGVDPGADLHGDPVVCSRLAFRSTSRARIASAARSARAGSSSCAFGTPNTAITASPMYFSTVPPCASISPRTAANHSLITSRNSSTSRRSASCVEPVTSAKRTVTTFRSPAVDVT